MRSSSRLSADEIRYCEGDRWWWVGADGEEW
jgi:hypothetical protein